MLIIDQMGVEHIQGVADIEKQCFSSPWSLEAIKKEVTENKLAKYYVAMNNNEVVGYIGFWVICNEAHITNLAVSPNNRGKGIGQKLVEELITFSHLNKIEGITLEVRASNKIAKKLYMKMGFCEEGVRKNYYSNPKEDACIMWKY